MCSLMLSSARTSWDRATVRTVKLEVTMGGADRMKKSVSAIQRINRRLVKFDCQGLHVDTGNFEPAEEKVDREQRFCFVCEPDTAEDKHHFVTALHIVRSLLLPFSGDQGPAPTLSSFFAFVTRGSLPSVCMSVKHRSMLLEGTLGCRSTSGHPSPPATSLPLC